MFLNDVFVENRVLMPPAFKKSLVAAYGHLAPDDQAYMIDHIEKFIPERTVIYFPMILGYVPVYLNTFCRCLDEKGYVTRCIDINTEYPAVAPTDIIVGLDIMQLSTTLHMEEKKDWTWLVEIGSIPFTKSRKLYEAYNTIAIWFNRTETDVSLYPKALCALATDYDTIMTLRVNSLGLQTAWMMRAQTAVFAYMANGPLKTKMEKMEFVLMELNILTSLVTANEVFMDKKWLITPRIIEAHDREMEYPTTNINEILTDLFHMIDEREPHDPFIANKFKDYLSPNIAPLAINTNGKNVKVDEGVNHSILMTTRKRIRDLIEEKTNVVEEEENISFDIPEELLTMYALEFGREYPMMLVPFPETEENTDGCNWRHLIQYEKYILVSFYLKDAPKKLYGIYIIEHNGDIQSYLIFEFTGKKDMNYEFVY